MVFAGKSPCCPVPAGKIPVLAGAEKHIPFVLAVAGSCLETAMLAGSRAEKNLNFRGRWFRGNSSQDSTSIARKALECLANLA